MTETTALSEQLTSIIARSVTKSVPPMGMLLVGAIVQAIRTSGNQRYVLLGIGALASMIAVFAYSVLVSAKLKGHVGRGWAPMLVTFSALIPYLFGCYLFFYEGLWRLTRLRNGVSGRVLVLSFLFVVAGYWLVSATHRLSEIAKFEPVTKPSAAAV